MLTSRCIVIRCRSASYICVIATKSVTQTLCKQIVQNNETSLKAKWSNTNWTCVLHFIVFQEILVLESLVFQDLFLGHKTLLVIMVVVPFSSWLRLAIVLAAVVLLSILCLQQLNVSIRFTQKDKDKDKKQGQGHTKGQKQKQTRSGRFTTWHDMTLWPGLSWSCWRRVTRSCVSQNQGKKFQYQEKWSQYQEKIPILREIIPISGKRLQFEEKNG